MILTITLNTSVDIRYSFDDFNFNEVNRCSHISKTAGGKGLNVTRVLKDLEADVLATGFVGGHNGRFISEQLAKRSIKHHFIDNLKETRNCINIIYPGGQTEILESGEEISPDKLNQFNNLINRLLNQVNVVTISGSSPPGIPLAFYDELMNKCKANDIPLLFDSSGKTLNYIVNESSHKPFLIKPNEDEFKELLKISDDISITDLKNCCFKDIPIVLVTLGEKGAIAKINDSLYKFKIPKYSVKNTVGSGDSTIAGIAYYLDQNFSLTEAVRSGLTCGTLNALEIETGRINKNNFNMIYETIEQFELGG